jgi:glucokinase
MSEGVASGRLTVGVDLGGTKIQAVAVRDAEVVGKYRVATPHTGTDDVVARIADTIDGALAHAGLDRASIAAVGLGSPGRIDRAAGVVAGSPNIPGFQEPVDLGPRLSRVVGGAPVTLENDVRAAMLGEHARGAGRPYRNLLGVFLGTGVGGGLVLDGALRDGRGAAGEVGHLVVKPGGRMCSDGRRGHLEAYAGRASMEARARRLVERGRHTTLFQLMEKKGRDRLSSGVIVQAADDGDEVARELVDDAAWALSIALASVQNLLDLEAVIIGGGLGDRLGRPFVDRVTALLQPLLFVPNRPPVIVPTELGDLSGAVGAAILVGG